MRVTVQAKPCPFCGREAVISKTWASESEWQIGCDTCKVFLIRSRRSDAVRRWNRRMTYFRKSKSALAAELAAAHKAILDNMPELEPVQDRHV